MATNPNQQAAALSSRMGAIRGSGVSKETALIRELQKRIGSANWSKWQMTRWSFYDYIRYTVAGVSELNFFANSLGTADPVSTLAKTFEQTNVSKSRSFGQVYYVLHQIRTHISLLPKQRQTANTIAFTFATLSHYRGVYQRIVDLMQSGVLQIKLGQKDYFEIPQPFINCPPGFGLELDETAVASTVALTHQNYIAQQDPSPAAVWNVVPQQLIEPEQTIEAKIIFPNGTSTAFTSAIGGTEDPRIDIGLLFDGYVVRPAQ